MNDKLKLVSFKLCPFVQRAVIALIEKGIDFDITYIELDKKPDWFLRMSPLGKVPVLQVGDQILFESGVILEYLDEANPPHMHPADPLQKAFNRAWMEFGSSLISAFAGVYKSITQESFMESRELCEAKLQQLNEHIIGDPFFNGDTFSLIDISYGPLFMRLQLVQEMFSIRFTEHAPKVQCWIDAVISHDSVQQSIVPEWESLFKERLIAGEPYLLRL